MRKTLTTIFLIIMILSVAGVALLPQQADAACINMISFHITDCVADLGNVVQSIFGVILTITATLLSVSLNLTIHIADIYKATPSIGNVWIIIRNISSIFIIFMLLYTSIQTILDIGSPNIKKLIGNIIIAGLLINFSLFFTKIAIDASNLISLQFYRAIAPQYASTDVSPISSAYYDGGLSNIFMQSLKIQKIYHPKDSGIVGGKSEGSIFMSIVIATWGAVLLMLFASISFLAAAAAFTIRTGILLLLMVFSPVYFVGMIFPTIKKDLSDKWLKHLTNQLMFMPIYLLLLYVSLRIISDPGFMSFLSSDDKTTTTSPFGVAQLGVMVQYFIALLFINAPLLAAIEFGAVGTKFAENMTKGLRDRVYNAPGFVAQHTVGRAARRTADAVATSKWASKNPNLAILADKTLGKISSSNLGGTKGGYDKRFKDFAKERSEFVNKRYNLATDKIEDIEERTRSGAKIEINSKLSTAQGTITEAKQKIDSNTAAAALAEERFNGHKQNIDKLEEEHKQVSEVFGSETPAARKLKERIQNERVEAGKQSAAVNKARTDAAKAVEEEKKAKEEEEKYGAAVKAIEESEKTGKKITDAGINKTIADHEETVKKKIREETRATMTEQFAADLDNDRNPITRRASKEAANQIRKNKSKPKSQIDLENIIKSVTESGEKKEEKEEKKEEKK